MSPVESIQIFFKKHHLEGKPLLLALSGGPDSLCLFFSLLAYREKFDFDLHVAHVDHGWREESEREATELKQWVESYGIPFHLIRLDCSDVKGNLEAYCREERYRFFQSICKKHSLQGVLTGHHGDDQAETVLKRVLEGSHWSCWQGLQEENILFGVRVLRPFLSLQKKVFLQWLKANKKTFFSDSTNDSLNFLRPRLRHQIIPWLSQEFGKEVSSSLLYLSEEIGELKTYFDERTDLILQKIEQGPFGLYLDLQNQTLAQTETKYLILQLCKQNEFFLSRHQVQLAATFLQNGFANKLLQHEQRTMIIDRKRIFISNFLSVPFENTPLRIGEQRIGPWLVQVSEKEAKEDNLGWKGGWKGEIRSSVPKGEYSFGLPKANAEFSLRSLTLSKWWNNHQVPAFLRNNFPIIWEGERVYHEFLTGRSPLKESREKPLSIALFYEG